jgi:hypothetical protein
VVGGLSPVVFTSSLMVVVVVPSGVVIFVSFTADDLVVSVHPTMLIKDKLATRVTAIKRFISKNLFLKIRGTVFRLQRGAGYRTAMEFIVIKERDNSNY